MLKGNAPVEFTKGESYKYEIQFDEINYQNITSAHISCKELNFCNELIQDETDNRKWYYIFTSDETLKFRPITTTYSLIVESEIEALSTQILANQPFEVKKNDNPSCLGV